MSTTLLFEMNTTDERSFKLMTLQLYACLSGHQSLCVQCALFSCSVLLGLQPKRIFHKDVEVSQPVSMVIYEKHLQF